MPQIEVVSKGVVRLVEVDQQDHERFSCFKWHLDRKGYVYRNNNEGNTRRPLRLHREIMGVTDPKIKIDHRDGNTFNNKRDNLRVATTTQNARNSAPKKQYAGKERPSKFKGVSRKKGMWRMTIRLPDGKNIDKLFKEEQKAADAYDDLAVQHFGEFARTNRSSGH